MDRLKTLISYGLILILFFIISNLLENGFIYNMYSNLTGIINDSAYIKGIFTKLDIKDLESKATNVNGYIYLNVENTMNSDIEKCYLKLDLYNERNLLAETEYIEISDFKSGSSKNYNLKFKANNIERYKIELLEQAPDESHKIRLLGWEIDLKKFGIDPTNIFGFDLTKINFESIKQGGATAWEFCMDIAKSIPTWAYVVAGGIVLWSLPSGYLFFL